MEMINKVYIIDDDPITIFLTKKILKSVNFCRLLTAFQNPKKALNTIKTEAQSKKDLPDILLLDINMPHLDGWQFIEELIKIPCHGLINVIMVSSTINPDDINKARFNKKVSDIITKPLTQDKVNDIHLKHMKWAYNYSHKTGLN